MDDMKKIFIFLMTLLPSLLYAQKSAEEFLDKAAARIKADAALQMNYDYTVYDDDDVIVYSDNGVMLLDNRRYSLLMENMKVWSDGETQWSYMKDIDEVYITEADSEEAQNLSPLYIMEKYRNGCSASIKHKGGVAVVTLVSQDEEDEVGKVELYINKESYMLESLYIFMPSQGRVEVFLNGYVPNCKFGDDVYRCPVEKFPSAEIVDMR